MKYTRVIPAVISTILVSHCLTSAAFSVPFFEKPAPAEEAKQADQHPISPKELERLTKTIDAIQRYYIKNVDDETLMDNAISGMVTRLDPHSAFLNKQELADIQSTVSGEFVGIGVELTTDRGMLKVISPIEGSPAQKAGLKPGDLIAKVNNKLIQDMTTSEAIDTIKGKPGTSVLLTIIRKGSAKPLVVSVMRDTVKVQAVQSKLLMPGYVYIRVSQFQGNIDKKIQEDIQKLQAESGGQLKGLVLDLRNNPGGLLDVSADVINLFLDKSETQKYHNLVVYTKGRIPSDDVSYSAQDHDLIPHVPMVVLINGGSASASEIVAGALQDYKRAVIMGTRSFGKGSVQTLIPISSNTALKLTTALYYTPSGREIQARGIEPDVIVPELSVDEKKMAGILDVDEANYGNHIENRDGNNDSENRNARYLEKRHQQDELVKLAKEDYQLYEALMMLKGAHALK